MQKLDRTRPEDWTPLSRDYIIERISLKLTAEIKRYRLLDFHPHRLTQRSLAANVGRTG